MTELDISEALDKGCGDVPDDQIFAMLERVQPLPSFMRAGIASFKIGQSFGFLRGLLTAHGIPFDMVSPQTWQKSMGCLTGGNKNVSKAAAQRLFPSVKCTHAISDALLLAEFCKRTVISRHSKATAA
jgi:hypothetical protein